MPATGSCFNITDNLYLSCWRSCFQATISEVFNMVAIVRGDTIQDKSDSSLFEKRLASGAMQRFAELRHLHRKLRSLLEWKRNRNKPIARIANKLQKIRLRIVIHHIPANAKLWSDDPNHLARQRRPFIAWPAVDQGEIQRTAQIA